MPIPRAALSLISGLCLIAFFSGCHNVEESLLFHPTHRNVDTGLTPWIHDGKVIGYARVVDSPKNIWLMLHGNAGQASDRGYAIRCFSPDDSVYVLEYPGFGNRPGVPSKPSINRAAEVAYRLLRSENPHRPVCVLGESLGSGPACFLASLSHPPDKLVLVVPFDRLDLVAADHFPGFLVKMLLTDNWNNVSSLSHYKGPVQIFGARDDTVIPVRHAKALAASDPKATFTLIPGGHNDWSRQSAVRIRNP